MHSIGCRRRATVGRGSNAGESVLVITKLPGKWGLQRPLCANRCLGLAGTRVSNHYISILDRPYPGADGSRAGYFCTTCSEELRALWDSVLEGTEPAPSTQHVCGCGCDTPMRGRQRYLPGHKPRKIYGERAALEREKALARHARRKVAA